jgi:hypothetical protein
MKGLCKEICPQDMALWYSSSLLGTWNDPRYFYVLTTCPVWRSGA